jgi:uncharacterized protein (TIGR02646 family)
LRSIRKGREPKGWAEYRLSTPGATYEQAPKDELRRALLAEQGYVCCYCMRRIDEGTTRIEHRRPRDPYINEQFTYRNLLAACEGGEGPNPARHHCDVAKHNKEITIDPADPSRNVEDLLRYSASGAIRSEDEAVHRDVDVTLKLNLDWLKDARLEVLDGFQKVFERKHQGTWPPEVIERELRKWAEIPPGGRLVPYAGIVVHYLRKRLQRATVR